MQITPATTTDVNAQASIVAIKAREINATLKKSIDTITDSILATKKAAQKLQDAQNADEVYKQTLESMEQLKKVSDVFTRELDFSVNKEINRVVVRIVDKNTKEIIKVIPSEEAQYIQLKIQELLGLLFDEEV